MTRGPGWVDDYIDVLTTGFAGVPGAFVPKPGRFGAISSSRAFVPHS